MTIGPIRHYLKWHTINKYNTTVPNNFIIDVFLLFLIVEYFLIKGPIRLLLRWHSPNKQYKIVTSIFRKDWFNYLSNP